jgi:probable phosphoglycerate mutase
MADLLLLRHGETAWTRTRRHTGRTDVPLTDRGKEQARQAAGLLAGRRIALTLVSPLERARHTARLAGLRAVVEEPDLREWDYGGYEGLTSADIKAERPGWDLWSDGVPPGDPQHPGESPQDVAARADRVLARVGPLLDGAGDTGDVLLVAHAHILRVLTARRLGLPPAGGAHFRLDTGALGVLGTEHGRPVVTAWNLTVPAATAPTSKDRWPWPKVLQF